MTIMTRDALLPILSEQDIKLAAKEGIEFMYLDQNEEDRWVSMLYYGGSGVGKTYFIASAGPRTLIINTGKGLVTIRSPQVIAKYYKEGLPIITTIREKIDPKTGIFETARAFDMVEEAICIALEKFPDRFDTIAIDDASYLRAFAMNKGMEMSADLGRSKTLEKGRKSGDIMFAVQDYGAEMKLIEDFTLQTIEFCKAAHKHLILTAHERTTYKKLMDNQGKVIGEEIDKIKSGFTGRTFPDDVTKHFDLVWHATVVDANPNPIRRARTDFDSVITAKSRYPGVFNEIELNPDFQNIVTRVRSSLDGIILPRASTSPQKKG